MNPTNQQYLNAFNTLLALVQKSKAKNPSIIKKFIGNTVVNELYAVSSLYVQSKHLSTNTTKVYNGTK